MTSAKLYRRIILGCLWFLFLAVVYGKNRQTREEFEAQQEAEYAAIRNDPYLQYLDADDEEFQDAETRQRIARKQAMGKMKYAIEKGQIQ
ncbi:MAG: hypothetical protein H7Y09_14310 [Chitinophagaceae bacterium]|nr:hypothetical protein [Anaerolineae bacterium]